MEAPRLPPAVLAAASDRVGGALEVAATALDGLLEVADDRALLEEAAAVLEAGQPAMAPIWHLAVAARSPGPPSALAELRRQLTAGADAAVEAATAWLVERLAAHPGGGNPGAVATVSHSSLVDRVLGRLGQDPTPLPDPDPGPPSDRYPGPPRPPRPRARVTRTRRIVGPQHGRVAQPEVEGAPLSTAQGGDQDAGLSGAPVVGVVGADAIGPEELLNADGTRELVERLPTLVVATAVKLVPAEVFGRLGGAGFEVVPLEALAAVVIGGEVLSPAEAGRRAGELTVRPGD
jgi:hypothetical protein